MGLRLITEKFAAFQHQTAKLKMVDLEPLIDQIPDEYVYILTYRSPTFISSPSYFLLLHDMKTFIPFYKDIKMPKLLSI